MVGFADPHIAQFCPDLDAKAFKFWWANYNHSRNTRHLTSILLSSCYAEFLENQSSIKNLGHPSSTTKMKRYQILTLTIRLIWLCKVLIELEMNSFREDRTDQVRSEKIDS